MKTFLKKTAKQLIPTYLRRKVQAKLAILSGGRVFKNDYYDYLTQKLISTQLRSGDFCLDVGAHIGEVSEMLIKVVGVGNVHAFEPLPDLVRIFKNRLGEDVLLNEVALSDVDGAIEFCYNVSSPAFSGIKKRDYKSESDVFKFIKVETKRLDAYSYGNVRFIKIDVEGAELLVLEGGRQTLRKCKPIITFEHGLGAADKYGEGSSALYDLLSSIDYNLYTLPGYFRGEVLSRKAFLATFATGADYYFVAANCAESRL